MSRSSDSNPCPNLQSVAFLKNIGGKHRAVPVSGGVNPQRETVGCGNPRHGRTGSGGQHARYGGKRAFGYRRVKPCGTEAFGGYKVGERSRYDVAGAERAAAVADAVCAVVFRAGTHAGGLHEDLEDVERSGECGLFANPNPDGGLELVRKRGRRSSTQYGPLRKLLQGKRAPNHEPAIGGHRGVAIAVDPEVPGIV